MHDARCFLIEWGCVWGGDGAGGEEQILREWQGCTKSLIKFGEFYRKFLLTGKGGKGKVLSIKTSCTINRKVRRIFKSARLLHFVLKTAVVLFGYKLENLGKRLSKKIYGGFL